MKKPMTPEAALERLEDLCARSEQCSADLRRKLNNWLITPDKADKIMTSLVKGRFVDDRRFARAYAHDKLLYSGWGEYKISRGLYMKRIPRDIIEEAIAALEPEEIESVARRVLRSKARSIKEGNSYEGRTKLFRHGASRGFSASLIASIIRSENLWEPPLE